MTADTTKDFSQQSQHNQIHHYALLCKFEYLRLVQVDYNWKATDKRLLATYQAIAKTSYLPPIWTNGELGYIKYLIK